MKLKYVFCSTLPSISFVSASEAICDSTNDIAAKDAASLTSGTLRTALESSVFPLCDSGTSFQHDSMSTVFKAIVENNSHLTPEECKSTFSQIVEQCVIQQAVSGGKVLVEGVTYTVSRSQIAAELWARNPAKNPPKPKVPVQPSPPKPKPGAPAKSKTGKAETCQQKMKAVAAAVGSRSRSLLLTREPLDRRAGAPKRIKACSSTLESNEYLSYGDHFKAHVSPNPGNIS